MTGETKDAHADLRKQAVYALTAYMHHIIFDKTGKAPPSRILQFCADHCIGYAMGIVDKAVNLINGVK